MSTENSLGKRRKMEDDNHDETNTLTPDLVTAPSPDVWFEDGNMLFQAESTLFRVHRSLISAHSEVLSDLLANLTDADLHDGLLRLPEAADEITIFLRAIYDRRFFQDRDVQPFKVTATILRLGMKYKIDHLVHEAKARLIDENPTTFSVYNTLKAGQRILEHPGLPIDTINVARETGLLLIVPFAFMQCSRYTPIEIMSGVTRDDGSRAILSPDDQQICLTGLEALRSAQACEMFSWLDVGNRLNSNCPPKRGCYKQKLKIAITIWRPPLRQILFKQWHETKWEEGLCFSCANTGQLNYKAGMLKVWEQLPSFFGLPDWQDLTKKTI